MKTAVGYIRVSTEEQVRGGVSIAAQESKIRNWANLNDFELIGIYVDAGISGGKTGNRPGLHKALQDVGKDSALVVYSLSRLARSTRDALQISESLNKIGADLVSLTERIDTTTASGKMVFRLLAVLAEFERDQVSERVKFALTHLKAQSRRVGTIPFGWKLKGKALKEVAKEQECIKMMVRLRASGRSYRAICECLENGKRLSKNGGRWHPKVVKGILERVHEMKGICLKVGTGNGRSIQGKILMRRPFKAHE